MVPLFVYVAAGLLLAPVVALLAWLIVSDLRNRLIMRKLAMLPGPPALPLIGAFHHVPAAEYSPRNELYWFDKFGPTSDFIRYVQLATPCIISRCPKVYRQVLVAENLAKDVMYARMQPWLGKNSLSVTQHANGGPWRRQRSMLNPAFRPSALKTLQDVFQRHSDQLADQLQPIADTGEPFDLARAFSKTALNIIGDMIGAGDAPPEFQAAVLRLTKKLISMWLVIPIVGGRIHGWNNRHDFAIVNKFIYRAIQARRAAIQRGEETTDDLLDRLLRVQAEHASAAEKEGDHEEPLDDTEIRDHLFGFYIAGHETTANTLAWMTYQFIKDTDMRDRVEAEADAQPHPIPAADVKNGLKLMSHCFHETLRCYPPVVYVQRETRVPVTLAGTDVVVPAGVTIQVSMYGMQRDPRWWGHDADEWRPDRWAEDEAAPAEKRRDPLVFAPWTAGPRVCIGRHFSHLEALTIMYTLMQRYRFSLVPGVEGNGEVTRETGLLRPNRLVVYVHSRSAHS